MRTAVTPAAGPSTTATLARRIRALRIALAITLIVAVPLIVALAAHQGNAGTEDAYREQARADATAVARVAAETPRAELAAELRRLRRANLARADAAGANRDQGFPLGLALGVAAAALLAYVLISRFGLSRLARLARELAEGQESLAALALEDPLTGLPNKRAFNDRLEAELAARRASTTRSRRRDRPGQVQADQRHLGPRGRRRGAQAARAGAPAPAARGDLRPPGWRRVHAGPGARRRRDRRAGARAHQQRARLRRDRPRSPEDPFSAGIAEFPRHSTEMEQIVNCADGALYWARPTAAAPGTSTPTRPARSSPATSRPTTASGAAT